MIFLSLSRGGDRKPPLVTFTEQRKATKGGRNDKEVIHMTISTLKAVALGYIMGLLNAVAAVTLWYIG